MEVIMATYSFINATKDALDAIRKAKTLSTVKTSNGNVIADLKFEDDEQIQEEYYPFKIFTDGDYIKVFPGDLELDYNTFSIQTPFGILSQQDQELFNLSGDFDNPIPISSFQNGDYVAAIALRKYQDGSLSSELFFFEDTSLDAHPNLNGFYSHSIGYVSISSQIIDNEQVKFVSDIRQWINTNIVDNYVPFENEFAISYIINEGNSQNKQIKNLSDFSLMGYYINGGHVNLNGLSAEFSDFYSSNIPETDYLKIYISYFIQNDGIQGSCSAYIDDLPNRIDMSGQIIYNVKLGEISTSSYYIDQQWRGGSINEIDLSQTISGDNTFIFTEQSPSGTLIKFDGSVFSRSINSNWDAMSIQSSVINPSGGFNVDIFVDESKIFDDFIINQGTNVTVNGSGKSWTISVLDSTLENWWSHSQHETDQYKVKVGGNTDPLDPSLDTPGFLKNKLKVDPESPIGDLISLNAVSGDYYFQTPYNTSGLIGFNGTNFTKISLEIAPALSGLLTIQEDYANNRIVIGTNAPSTGNYALTCNDGKIQWTEMDECE